MLQIEMPQRGSLQYCRNWFDSCMSMKNYNLEKIESHLFVAPVSSIHHAQGITFNVRHGRPAV